MPYFFSGIFYLSTTNIKEAKFTCEGEEVIHPTDSNHHSSSKNKTIFPDGDRKTIG